MRFSLVRIRFSRVRMRFSRLRMRFSRVRMRFSRVVRASDCQSRVLGSIPTSSDTTESERRQMNQCWIKYIKHYKKIPLFNVTKTTFHWSPCSSMILGLLGPAGGKGRDQAVRHCDWRTERLAGPHPRHRSQGQTHRVSETWGPKNPGSVPSSVEVPRS